MASPASRVVSSLLVSCCLTLATVVWTGSAAHAASAGIRFALIQYDPPGKDTRNNKQVNAEYVVVTNRSSRSRTLKGWLIKDKAGHRYIFRAITLRPGKSVTVHTGIGTNTTVHRYWGRRSYVWNNTGDTAILVNVSGRVVDTCTWGRDRGKIRC